MGCGQEAINRLICGGLKNDGDETVDSKAIAMIMNTASAR